jgi:hypothetical protein
MRMQQGFGAARGPKSGPFRAERTKPVAEAPGNRRNHPAATRIAGSYGESRIICVPGGLSRSVRGEVPVTNWPLASYVYFAVYVACEVPIEPGGDVTR